MTAPHRGPSKSRPLSIGALSRATRIPVETLRTWERRYGVPVAIRSASGHRQFSAATVEHLRQISALLDQGYRPGEILGLPDAELKGLLDLAARPRAEKAPDSPRAVDPSPESMVDALEQFDRVALIAALRINWARLGPLRFLEECVSPFLFAVGKGWEEGRLHIRHEHFASECVSDVLRELREPFDRRATGSRVALATLPGDLHQGALLMASLVVALRGHRVLYLGADTPVEQVAAAARDGEADLVVLGISSSIPRGRAGAAVEELRELLPRRVPLWLGGMGAPVKPPRGVVRLATLADLDARLERERDPDPRA